MDRTPVETFTDAERALLAPHFTNLDGPVFALVNLPEAVKAALFARYSRSPMSLRRLFLDEFVDQVAAGGGARTGEERAERLMDRVFLEYGDDSVAQLGGAHLACEGASNVLTKVLEWGRLMAYLEQSTRYMVGIGGAYGKGQVYDGKNLVGYAKLKQGTIGLALGGQSFIEVIFFQDKSALNAFKEGNWEFAANASAVAVKAGAGATSEYSDGVKAFVFVKGGLMAEASVGGQHFFYEAK